MKLATYKDGSRDGQLLVVSRDLSQAHYATGIAQRMQQVLDDWNFLAPQLEDLYATLNQGKARHAFPFDAAQCMAPLPRAFQYASGLGTANHVDLLYPERAGASDADALVLYQGCGHLQGACDKALFADDGASGNSEMDPGIDFEAGLAVITGDVPAGAPPEQALDGVRLLMLANGWTLRQAWAEERARGFGFLQSKPAVAFSPVAITPDELGDAWSEGRVHLTLQTAWNGRTVGLCEAGEAMEHNFGQLVAALAATRRVRVGSIVASGALSNRAVEADGRWDWPKGYGCIAEKRAMETRLDGQAATAYMKFGDRLRIEMKGRDGLSVFGPIEQQVASRAG
ncbi:fumarylacetoacetate hydrolase [Hylemonella gracilis str. Niagara R]|uniref:Fumarylacetoacetate hydrolase n=1 Tax=Hylemonella gracilis str. Niagara R TaxID=1458275 RepID=A0A016XMB3_9BURK|nr:fumarylacetoacetate hydrolase family protein [Hylemonella gracilis]EYC52712.1 fumarylacetoacetate hydrolase [Hylemonella gracilis str. Niagara R]